MDYQQEMAYGELNGHVTDDVMWTRKLKVMAIILREAGDTELVTMEHL